MLLSEKDAKGICDTLLGHVKADDAVVNVSSEDYGHLRFAAGSFTTSGRREDVNVNVTAWVGKRRGGAATNDLSPDALAAVVREAEEIAAVSPEDREYVESLGPQQYKPTQGFVEATAAIAPAARAKAVSDVIGACEKDDVVGAGFHQSRGAAQASATKHGNFAYSRGSLASLSLTARTKTGDGSGYFLRNHHDIAKLDAARVARESIQKALRSREPRALDAGQYSVVLEPQAVADLLGFFTFAFDARQADEGRSAFSAPGGKTRVGETLFDERISVYADPWHPELPGSPQAQGGIPAQKLHLVKNGVLETLVYSRFWAKQKGTQPTPGPVNGIMESSAPPVAVEAMIKDTKRGLLVTRFWYIRPVDPRSLLITGLTRDGLWLIEDGKLAYPVRNFRFNQSLLKLLAPGNLLAIGAPERVGASEAQGSASSLLPALHAKEFSFTSQSEAV